MKKLWIVAVAAAHLGALNADTDRPKTTDGNRFLFVVETSATSSRLDHGGRQALVDLIYTGVYGQMRTGDTFGLWAFNEQVMAGVYPMQTWDSENTMELASNAGQFLKGQRYHKKGRFEPLIQDVLSLARGVKDVNIFIISDSETRPPKDAFGPAFDREYAERVASLPNSKTPLITTIVAHNGSISNWFVTAGSEPIRLPAFAIPAHPIAKPTVAATIAKAEPARPKRSAIIMKGSSTPATVSNAGADGGPSPKAGRVISNAGQLSFVSSLQTNAPGAAAATGNDAKTQVDPGSNTNVIAAIAPAKVQKNVEQSPRSPATSPRAAQSLPPEKNSTVSPDFVNNPAAVAAVQPPPPALPKVKTEATPPARAEAPLLAALPLLGPEPVKVAARERSDPNSSSQRPHFPAVTATAAPGLTDRLFSPAAMVVIGGLLLILAAALGLLLLQRMRRPPQASFITQSLEGQ